MSKTYNEIQKEEEKMFKEVIELLKLDGWVKVDGGFDDKVALIFTVYGDIVHRYVKWGSEYSEWHQWYCRPRGTHRAPPAFPQCFQTRCGVPRPGNAHQAGCGGSVQGYRWIAGASRGWCGGQYPQVAGIIHKDAGRACRRTPGHCRKAPSQSSPRALQRSAGHHYSSDAPR